jgi:hypothetical protein
VSLSANAKVLTSATRELSRQWEHTKRFWRDDKAAEFEREYLGELFSGVDRTAVLLEELDRLIARINKECE